MQGHAVGQVYVVRGLPTFRTPHFSLLHALAASLLSKDMRIIIWIFGDHFLVIDVLDFGFAGEVHGAALLHVLSTYFRKEARVWMRRFRIFLDCAQDGESRGS